MKIAIIGAGGHARVVYEILRHDMTMEVASFVDNERRGADEKIMGIPVVGDHSVLPGVPLEVQMSPQGHPGKRDCARPSRKTGQLELVYSRRDFVFGRLFW